MVERSKREGYAWNCFPLSNIGCNISSLLGNRIYRDYYSTLLYAFNPEYSQSPILELKPIYLWFEWSLKQTKHKLGSKTLENHEKSRCLLWAREGCMYCWPHYTFLRNSLIVLYNYMYINYKYILGNSVLLWFFF